jgi:hypothetical protein
MILRARNVAWLLPFLLSACIHNANQSQVQPLAPPIEDAPPLKPDSAPDKLPPPVITIPQENPIVVTEPETPKPAQKHKKPVSKPAPSTTGTSASQPPVQNTQVSSVATPPEVNAIGQLATKETPDSKKQASDTIAEVEKGLTGIGRKLSDQEEKTSTQIKEFLKQARTALNSGDIDGAHTLATKAKALLGELTP